MANEMIKLDKLINLLYERVEEAKAPALRPSACIVERNEMLDLLDELRGELPAEIKRSQELLAARDRFVEEAKRDVERKMRQAEMEAKAMVSESEVLYAAKEKAAKIVANAEERSKQLYQVTNEYAEDALARTEEAIQAALAEVHQSRLQFHATSNAKMQEQKALLSEEPVADGEDTFH